MSMTDRQTVWVDVERCTGCGACVSACPVAAITLIAEKAHVDEERCTGCEVCIDACPQGAIQPVVQGELVPAEERPPPAVRRPSPLAQTARTGVLVTGLAVLTQIVKALGRVVDHWLLSPSTGASSTPASRSSTGARSTSAPPQSTGRGTARRGGGRRARHRRRGR
jgi:Fe-S-cluster-containing hydrogenase component 2